MGKVLTWIKSEIVLVVAWILAIATAFLVPIDSTYLEYIHWDTLSLLLILMLVMAGFKKLGVLNILGHKLIHSAHSRRKIELVLVLCCFFGGMVVTNDVALITFVPFAIITLKMAGLERDMAYIVILQGIAANLGAMLTPIGNPHNIYFYFLSGASPLEFMKYTTPYTFFGLVLLIVAVCIRKNSVISEEKVVSDVRGSFCGKKLAFYIALFALGIFSLTKIVAVPILAGIVAVAVLVVDRDVFKKVDYSLLLTFVGFFIFVGNMQRIDAIANMFASFIDGHEMIASVGLSQVISNLPAALLLSGFTDRWEILMVGTDIGGLGTIIASMANLIAYRAIRVEADTVRKHFLLRFMLICFIFLAFELLLYYAVLA